MTENDQANKQEKKEREIPPEQTSQTRHSVTIDGQEIHYTATAGTIHLTEEEKETKAAIFFIAYSREDGEPATRPVTFSFNGGPGSSSVWLHLGVLGPRRVALLGDGSPPPPPYRLVDNAYSMLDVTDLVFIDPVTTGFSRAISEEEEKRFHEFQKDIESVAEFIRLYCTRYQRWASPKFLIGESYGTTRAGGLADHLHDRHGMYLNGIMLISSSLNFQTAHFDPGNDLPYILFLPSYTATAWFHKQLDEALQADLQATLREVENFARTDYALALMQGTALPDAQRQEIARRLARYTGLSQQYVQQTNLRIEIFRFVKELLREQRRTVGRLDSRFTGIDRDAAGENHEFDPSYAAIQGPFTATFNDYVRRELAFESDLPYEILTSRVQPWSYEKFQNAYVNTAEALRKALCLNPYLRVFVANGYFDLATPYFATQYTFNHMDLDPALQPNVAMAYYESGHMMYIHQPSLAQLKQDLAGFIRSGPPG